MKKIMIALSILIVIGILGFVAYKAFLAPKVPQEFIEAHNKISNLSKDVETLTDPNGAPDFEKPMNSEDYNGAIKAIDETLANENKALEKLKIVDSELAKLKILSDKITNAKAKEASLNRINYGEKENVAKIGYIALRIQMLDSLKEIIGHINKDTSLFTAADEKAVNDLSAKITEIKNQTDKASSELESVQSQYKAAEEEFMSAANLSKV